MMFAAARLMTGAAGVNFGLGDFALFIAYLGTLADCVNRIVELVAESRKAEVSYERICNAAGADDLSLSANAGLTLFRDKVRGKDKHSRLHANRPEHRERKILKVKNLSFNYDDGKGFSGVSFTLEPGELMAVTGQVGSGKSTLMSVLTGILPVQAGEISFGDRIIAGRGTTAEPANIIGVPQRNGFFSGTLRENICLGLEIPDDEIYKALSLAAFDEFLAPGSLDIEIGGRGSRLSGGQQQRLALARMYARNAGIFVIDDCVSALDAGVRKKVLDRMNEHLKETARSVIIATNEPEFVNAADRVLKM